MRNRLTTSCSTGASRTATTSTSSASSSSRPMPRPVGAVVLPKGEEHTDEYFGTQEIYRQSLDASFAVPPGAQSVAVKVTYQGCADAGLCYPPITKLMTVSLEGAPTSTATSNSANGGGYVSE